MCEEPGKVGPPVSAEDFAQLYEELKRLAHARMARERGDHTLQTTALVNETFLRLCREQKFPLADRRLFFPAAAEAMRRILVEHARARNRLKRGGGGGGGGRGGARLTRISLDTLQWLGEDNLDQTLTFDEALRRLEREAADEAQIVRLRFFAGLSNLEVAEVLGVSLSTVERRWRWARAWLWRELRDSVGPEPPR